MAGSFEEAESAKMNNREGVRQKMKDRVIDRFPEHWRSGKLGDTARAL